MTEQGSRTQEAILRTMVDHERRTGLPATVREIARETRIGADMSTGLVCYHLKRLVAAGVVTHQPGRNRTYQVISSAAQARDTSERQAEQALGAYSAAQAVNQGDITHPVCPACGVSHGQGGCYRGPSLADRVKDGCHE
jgi:SOS-response transcriptional repressor LexA